MEKVAMDGLPSVETNAKAGKISAVAHANAAMLMRKPASAITKCKAKQKPKAKSPAMAGSGVAAASQACPKSASATRKQPMKRISLKHAHAFGRYYAAALREAALRQVTQLSETCPIESARQFLAQHGNKDKPTMNTTMEPSCKKKKMMTLGEQQLSLGAWVTHMKDKAFTATCTRTWAQTLKSALVHTKEMQGTVAPETIRCLIRRFQERHRHLLFATAASEGVAALTAAPAAAAAGPTSANILLVRYATENDTADIVRLSSEALSTEIKIAGEETVEDTLRRFFAADSNAAELVNWQVLCSADDTHATINPAAHKAKDVKAVLLCKKDGG